MRPLQQLAFLAHALSLVAFEAQLKLFLAVLILSLILAGCATAKLSYSGGDGASQATAVVIKGVRDSEAGVNAENAWIRERYGLARKSGQALLKSGRKYYDQITIVTSNRETRQVCFDITSFFGK